MSRRVFGLFAVLLFVAGCGGAQTYPRTTVPVKVDKNRANDPRLSMDKLRQVDPCGVLQRLDLKPYGGAAGPPETWMELNECKRSLAKAPDTFETHVIRLSIGIHGFKRSPGRAETTVDGLPAIDENKGQFADGPPGCKFKILTDKNGDDGIEVQYSNPDKNCTNTRPIAKGVLDILRDNPPRWEQNSIAAVKPCDLLDMRMMDQLLGGIRWTGQGVDAWHRCAITGNDGLRFTLSFANEVTGDSIMDSDKQKAPVPLGNGVTGTQTFDSITNECRLKWLIRKTGATQAVVGDVQVNKADNNADFCGIAVKAAKSVVPRLPR